MYTGKLWHNSIMVVTSISYSGANTRTTPNECGTKWLPWQHRLPIATGQLTLQFMVLCFKNENVY